MGSLSRVPPHSSTAVSPSLMDSSQVKPYCKQEKPPPEMKTRSFKASLPSSSSNCFTLRDAASVKTKGDWVSIACALMLLLHIVDVNIIPIQTHSINFIGGRLAFLSTAHALGRNSTQIRFATAG